MANISIIGKSYKFTGTNEYFTIPHATDFSVYSAKDQIESDTNTMSKSLGNWGVIGNHSLTASVMNNAFVGVMEASDAGDNRNCIRLTEELITDLEHEHFYTIEIEAFSAYNFASLVIKYGQQSYTMNVSNDRAAFNKANFIFKASKFDLNKDLYIYATSKSAIYIKNIKFREVFPLSLAFWVMKKTPQDGTILKFNGFEFVSKGTTLQMKLNNSQYIDTKLNICDGTYHFISMTYRNGLISIYKDRTCIVSELRADVHLNDTNYDLFIGTDGAINNLQGEIGEIQVIHNYIYDATDINTNVKFGMQSEYKGGRVIGYFNFSGDTIEELQFDLSEGENHLVGVNVHPEHVVNGYIPYISSTVEFDKGYYMMVKKKLRVMGELRSSRVNSNSYEEDGIVGHLVATKGNPKPSNFDGYSEQDIVIDGKTLTILVRNK